MYKSIKFYNYRCINLTASFTVLTVPEYVIIARKYGESDSSFSGYRS